MICIYMYYNVLPRCNPIAYYLTYGSARVEESLYMYAYKEFVTDTTYVVPKGRNCI